MALATENSNKVWQKVKIALADANPVAQAAFAELKKYLATQGRNPDLQIVLVDRTLTVGSGGQDSGIDAACTVYGAWFRKPKTATAAYSAIFDDATDDAGAGTDGRFSIGLLGSTTVNQEVFVVYPQGLALSAGLVIKNYTDFDGTTDGSNADATDGFVIVGA